VVVVGVVVVGVVVVGVVVVGVVVVGVVVVGAPVVLVVVLVEVVPLSGVLTGDAAACAGTMTDSTTGLIHLEGRRMVTVRPPTVKISSTRRRVALNSLMKCPHFANFLRP
jgi:hypothetical protein